MQLTIDNNKLLNFKRTALFICHLYISGHFGTVHLIADSTPLTHQLLIDVHNSCPRYVPIITTSATSTQFPLWTQPTDHILQLVFVDCFNGIVDRLNRLKDYAVFYQVCLAPSTGLREPLVGDLENRFFGDVFRNTLLLLYNTTFDTSEIYVRGNLEQPIYVTNQRSMTNAYDQTFGKLDTLPMLAIQYTHETTCHSEQQNRRFVFPIIQRFLANYYASRMNITFLEGISTVCDGGLDSHYVRHHSQNVYKELFFGSEPLNNETMSGLHLCFFMQLIS